MGDCRGRIGDGLHALDRPGDDPKSDFPSLRAKPISESVPWPPPMAMRASAVWQMIALRA